MDEAKYEKIRAFVGCSLLARIVLQALLCFLIFLALNSVEVRAQVSNVESISAAQSGNSRDSNYRLLRGDNEFAIWGAGSFDAPTLIGSTYRPIAMLGLRYGRIMGTNQLGTLEYVVDIIPIQVVFDQENGRGTKGNVYGAGINYGGLKVSYLRRSRVKPFVSVSGGFIVYTRRVPLEGRNLNFTYSLDGGLDIFTGKKRALTVGYKFYHASDAVHTKDNIGTNDNMISIGFSLFR